MEYIKSFLNAYRKKIGYLGIALVALMVLYFFSDALRSLYKYYIFNASTEAYIDEIYVKERDDNKFVIYVDFHFYDSEEKYKTSSEFGKLIFPNEFAAQDYIKTINKKNVLAWYKKNDPAFAVLDKSFPWKSVLNCGILIIIFAYFIGFNRYLRWKKT